MENKYTEEERKQIVEEQTKEFFERVHELLPANEIPRVKAAYDLAAEAHSKQIRKSGIPYITHPIAVARIALVELGLKTNPVMAALLHDVVEDTDYTVEDLRERFGEDVAYLVGVLTKNSDGNYKVSKQIDNFKHMLDSINYDIRALLIKLADRMHNMRTLGSMRTDKQMKITLENLSLRWRSPQEYDRIEKKIDRYMGMHSEDIEAFLEPIRETLVEHGIEAHVYARPRSVYALWRKMKNTGQTFKELEHVHQVNIIIKFDEESGMTEKNQCLRVYSLLTDLYDERPYSLINYIDQPKENGYQSIHVQVMSQVGQWTEVHICTETMQRNSQLGCVIDRTEGVENWIRKFRGVLRDVAQSGVEGGFMESVVSSFYNDDMIIFTPKGHSIVLPKGSTVLDFAYEIHTNVGNHAKFARVNGRLCSIFTQLKRGDRVEVGTEENQLPEYRWLGHVNTYKARRAINVALNKSGINIDEFPYDLCTECNPLPGDEIMGFKHKDGKILVHKRNCPDAIALSAADGDSIVDVQLPILPGRTYSTRIEVNAVDRSGIMMDLINVIYNQMHLSIDSIHAVTEDYIGIIQIKMRVPSAFELSEVIRIIENVKGVEEVRTL